MERIILIKYGELTTKKKNRKDFIKKLESNIKNVLKNYSITIIKDRVRMYIKTNNDDVEIIANLLSKVFGIHSIVICFRVNTNKEEIQNKVLELIKDLKFKTFKVNTKRADKTFNINSMEFNKMIGSLVLKNYQCNVDVHNPELMINIEIRQEGTFISTSEIKGSMGYPVGIQGKGLLMLSGGIDSPVAGYLALKRGIDLDCIYFESLPHTSLEAKNKVIKLANILNNYSGNIKLYVVPFTKIQESIRDYIPSNYMITIMRRIMYKIAEKYALKKKIKILINGESIGQVASQTITSICVINETINMPVIRPVACLDKEEIIEIAKKINTYETSILPFEDCCTIFVPKHPVINPKLEKCIEYEKRLNMDALILECINNITVIKDLKPLEFEDLL